MIPVSGSAHHLHCTCLWQAILTSRHQPWFPTFKPWHHISLTILFKGAIKDSHWFILKIYRLVENAKLARHKNCKKIALISSAILTNKPMPKQRSQIYKQIYVSRWKLTLPFFPEFDSAMKQIIFLALLKLNNLLRLEFLNLNFCFECQSNLPLKFKQSKKNKK